MKLKRNYGNHVERLLFFLLRLGQHRRRGTTEMGSKKGRGDNSVIEVSEMSDCSMGNNSNEVRMETRPVVENYKNVLSNKHGHLHASSGVGYSEERPFKGFLALKNSRVFKIYISLLQIQINKYNTLQ